MYNLSEKAIAEKYEDLLFTKVMALYAAEESEKILSEIENEEPADPKNIEKIYSKTERRKNFSAIWKVSKKLVTFAAMVVFVAVVSLSSVVVASAEAREAVAEAIYHLVLRKTDRYTEVSIGNSTGFIDPENYDWEGAYAPTYIPEGFNFVECVVGLDSHSNTYENNEKFVIIEQKNKNYTTHIDTENAQIVKNIIINNCEALFIEKDGLAYITWYHEDTLFFICGNIDGKEIIKVAEGIKPLGKTETEEPAEEYEFVDPEHYNYENAYAPTYMTEEFVQTDCSIGTDIKIHIYTFEDKFIYIEQNGITAGSHIDTENAQVVKEIVINGSQALYVEKDGFAYISWSFPDALLFVCGNIDGKEIIKVAEGIKPLGKTETEEYEFVDPEIYDWEGAFAPTYIPKNFEISDIDIAPDSPAVTYSKGKQFFVIYQLTEGAKARIDSENADVYKTIFINGNEGLFIKKADEISITWNDGNIFFWLFGTTDEKELLKVAEGLKPLGKTETEEPAEEYEFVDPEIYDWEGAYAPTYVPNNYKFSDKYVDISYYAITYTCYDKYFYIDQTLGHPISQIDTENAQIVKEVIINGGQGILVVKNDLTSITWNVNNILFDVGGTAPTEEIIKVAEGIRPIN